MDNSEQDQPVESGPVRPKSVWADMVLSGPTMRSQNPAQRRCLRLGRSTAPFRRVCLTGRCRGCRRLSGSDPLKESGPRPLRPRLVPDTADTAR